VPIVFSSLDDPTTLTVPAHGKSFCLICDSSLLSAVTTSNPPLRKAGGGRPDANSFDRPGSCRTMRSSEPWPRRPLPGEPLDDPLPRDQLGRDDFGAEGSA